LPHSRDYLTAEQPITFFPLIIKKPLNAMNGQTGVTLPESHLEDFAELQGSVYLYTLGDGEVIHERLVIKRHEHWM
jgi:hypothetical protein